jgi:hypothetical protein
MAVKVIAEIRAEGLEIGFNFNIEDSAQGDEIEGIIAQRFLVAMLRDADEIKSAENAISEED